MGAFRLRQQKERNGLRISYSLSKIKTLLPKTLNFVLIKREKPLHCTHTFSTKNIGVFKIFTLKILTKHSLTTPLVVNNWALVFRAGYGNRP